MVEVFIGKSKRSAQSEATRLNAQAFVGQRYSVEPGVKPGTFAVVLFDGGEADNAVPITFRGGRGQDSVRDTAAMGGTRHYRRAHTASRTFG